MSKREVKPGQYWISTDPDFGNVWLVIDNHRSYSHRWNCVCIDSGTSGYSVGQKVDWALYPNDSNKSFPFRYEHLYNTPLYKAIKGLE
jgi:hypothetical protein